MSSYKLLNNLLPSKIGAIIGKTGWKIKAKKTMAETKKLHKAENYAVIIF